MKKIKSRSAKEKRTAWQGLDNAIKNKGNCDFSSHNTDFDSEFITQRACKKNV